MEQNLNEFDLPIGVHQIKYQIPGNFKYSKICNIVPGKLFRSKYFQITNLIAAGTTNGPIIIYTDQFKSLSHVCLLCSHSTSISDIIQLKNNCNFLSISTDGTISKWSNDDCSLVSSYQNIAIPGETKFALHPPNSNFIWVYTIGFQAFLFDLQKGVIVKKINVTGVTQLCFLDPKSCLLVKNLSLAILQFNYYQRFEGRLLENSIKSIDLEVVESSALQFQLNQNYYLNEYGLIRTNVRTWQIISPATFAIKLEGRIKGRVENDSISSAKFVNQNTLCLSTFGGRFIVYSLKLTKNAFCEIDYEILRFDYVISPIDTFVNDFIVMAKMNFERDSIDINHTSIVYQSNPKRIYSLKFDNSCSANSNPKFTKVYHVPRISSGRIVESDGKSVFYIRNWEKGGNSSFKYFGPSKITSMMSYESPRKKLEVIVGCKDGTLSFFSENSCHPFHTEIVFSSPVVGLANIPMHIRGRKLLFAAAEDGTAAILRNRKVQMIYANNAFPIDMAYYNELNESFILRRMDSSFIVFNIDQPGPIFLSSTILPNSIPIWSLNCIQSEHSNESSLNTHEIRFGMNSWFYASVGIPKLLNVQNKRTKLFSRFLIRLFQQTFDYSLTRSQSLTFDNAGESEFPSMDNLSEMDKLSKINNIGELSSILAEMDTAIPKSRSIQMLDWVTPTSLSTIKRNRSHPYQKIIDGLSLVIIGHDKISTTFFYPKYRICGDMAFVLSDRNSAYNSVIKTLIAGESSEEIHPELVKIFTTLMFCGNASIETAASIECDRIVDTITVEMAQQVIASLPNNLRSQPDKTTSFILSLLAINHSKLISKDLYSNLLVFLLRTSNTTEQCSSLSLSLLIRGYDFWSKQYPNAGTPFFVELIKCFIAKEKPKALEELFFSLAISRMKEFNQALSILIKDESKTPSEMKRLITLLSKLTFSDTQNAGTKITAKLIEIAAEYPSLESIINKELNAHSLLFPSVSLRNEYIAIGHKNGYLTVYKNYKPIVFEHQFDTSVDYVSIGPNATYCALISVYSRKAKIFSLPTQGLFSAFQQRKNCESHLDEVGKLYKISWRDETNCVFTVIE